MSYSCLNTVEGLPGDNCWLFSGPPQCSFLVPLFGVSVTEDLAIPPFTNFCYSLCPFWSLFFVWSGSFSSSVLGVHCCYYERCPGCRPWFRTISFFFMLHKVFHFCGKGYCLRGLNSQPYHQLWSLHCTPPTLFFTMCSPSHFRSVTAQCLPHITVHGNYLVISLK